MRIMRICANTANDDANKNKFKTQNQKSKLDIGCPNDIRCPKYSLVKKQNETILSIILLLRGAERQSNPHRYVASLRVPRTIGGRSNFFE